MAHHSMASTICQPCPPARNNDALVLRWRALVGGAACARTNRDVEQWAVPAPTYGGDVLA
jgi:hypothetical protein